jgi:hypothetical protein
MRTRNETHVHFSFTDENYVFFCSCVVGRVVGWLCSWLVGLCRASWLVCVSDWLVGGTTIVGTGSAKLQLYKDWWCERERESWRREGGHMSFWVTRSDLTSRVPYPFHEGALTVRCPCPNLVLPRLQDALTLP